MNIIEEIRAFREIVLGKQDKLVPGDHIILGDDDVISVDFGPVDALLDRLEEVEDDVNTLNFDVTELDIRLDAAEENIDDAQDHLDSIDDSIDVLSSDLEALGQKVDNIHGFEIIALSEGQYDPITMKPTIQNPKTNTLYLVPNYDPTQRNLWIEWLWLGGRWEQFGTAVIDLSEYVMKTDLPTTTTTGVVKVNRLNGVQLLTNGQLAITPASIGDISSGQSETLPITPYQQHNAVFYGLARAARTPALYYSAPDKTNIRLMLDAGSHAQVEELAEQVEGYGISVAQLLNTDKTTPAGMVWESKEYGAGWSEAAQGKVVDVLKDGESLMDEHGIVELPDVEVPTKTSDLVNDSGFITESALPTKVSDLENDSGFLVSSDLANYALISDLPTKVSDLQNDSGFLTEVPVASSTTVGGIKLSSTYKVWKDSDDIIHAQITNYEDYGNTSTKAFISKGTLENVLNGRGYPVDIRIDGATIVDENKVANIPLATLGEPGLIIIHPSKIHGLDFNGQYLSVMRPFDSEYKAGAITHKSINPAMQHYSTFYGLAKAAGHDEKDSTLAFGTYSDDAKTAIKNMLGITAGEKEIFEATYGVTTYDEIVEAVEDGKMVIMKSNNYVYNLTVLSNTQASFGVYRASKMLWAYVQSGDTVVWRSGTDSLQTDNLSKTIEGQETSTTKYPTTKAVVDYVGNAGFMPKSQLLDAGVKSISWTTSRSETTVTTTEDVYKSQRPSGTNTRYWGEFEGCPYFIHSKLYRVTFNGTVYDNLACRYGILVDNGTSSDIGGPWQLIGNKALYDSRYESTGEPFCIMYVEHGEMSSTGEYYYSSTVGHGILLTESASSNTLKIETATITEIQLPANFRDNFGQGDEQYEPIGSSTYSRVSIGMGNIVGRAGFAIGFSNIVTGYGSLAEGFRNTSTGSYSHVEGYDNNATATYAHSEGKSTKALAFCAHSEGVLTIADGSYSHAEGSNTISNGRVQHVQGQYNIKDESPIDTTHGSNARKYLHIVGNGTAENARSNAHTLDWNGLGWFKGGLKVGGTGQEDSNAENVVLESDLLNYALESDLEDLSRRVDALHGFEIVFLTTGEYDPETGIPTILGPQEGTLYLVPSGQEAPDVWTEWLWTGEAWEKFGSSSIDLSSYVKNTDYANASTGGVIKASMAKNINVNGSGELTASTVSYSDYELKGNDSFVGKGTLENVLAARIPDVPSISYDETEEMLVWQTTANDGNEVSY